VRTTSTAAVQHRAPARGFTLMEVLVVLLILAMLFSLILPNLGALVPSARLRSSGNQIRRTLDWVRSEARIQGKRMAMDFDLARGIYRVVHPPEERLTREQDERLLVERTDDWQALEDDVRFVGAGDGRIGLAEKGVYRLAFDEYGFTGDQVLILGLVSNPNLTWTLTIQGLTGKVDVHESETGERPVPPALNEGAF
jgi:prepilin-type N-terminal cleavage/methylation domain-containing protein